jgi:prephenate dehydrogenase
LTTPGLTVGLVGFGRFGSLAAKFIAKEAKVLIYDKRKKIGPVSRRRIRWGPLSEVAAQEVVILAVPVSALRDTLRSISPFLRRNSLVLDVCAVKTKPAQWMRAILPAHVTLLGTHPLFGPSSVKRSVRGQRIVLCPIRISDRLLRSVTQVFTSRGLEVIRMAPKAHDKMISETLHMTQLIGRMVGRAGLQRWARSTPMYDSLVGLADVAKEDTLGMFIDLWKFNPYADTSSNALWRAHREIHDLVNTKRKMNRHDIDS